MSEKIRKALTKHHKSLTKIQIFTGEVKDVDENEFTCDVDPIDGPTIYQVKLKPSLDNDANGMIVIPEKGSFVNVGIIGNDENNCFVIQYGKIKKVLFVSDKTNVEFNMTSGDILFNKGNKGGMVIVDELSQEINKISRFIEAFQNVVKSWQPVPNDGGAALKALSSSFVNLPLPETSRLENKKVKHGS